MEPNNNQPTGMSTTMKIVLSAGVSILILLFVFRDKIAAILGFGESPSVGAADSKTRSQTQTTSTTAPSVAISPGNYFVSGAAIDKVVQGKFDKWKDMNKDEYNAFYGKVDQLFGHGKANDKDVPWNVSYAQAFFKGMNLKPIPAYVEIFKNELQEYLNNPAKIPNWEVDSTPAGQFLKV